MVCADATYKLVDIKIPLYVLLVEDGNGQSEIAALGLLVNEQKDTLSWFFNKFKEHNPACLNTRVFITDKDMKERTVIKSLFPHSHLIICLFHTLRTFNREITCEKLGITPDQRDSSKKVFEELCYCKNEMEYQKIYTQFLNNAPHQVVEYFTKNWHSIREQWVTGLTYSSGNFLNSTNNRLESFNSKLKSVIPVFSNLTEFFKKLFIILKCIRTERDNNAINIIQKCPTRKFDNIDEHKYFKLLTPYAFSFLKKNLNCTQVTVLENTTQNSCSCNFFNSMKLPCSHIISKRRLTNNLIYDEQLCDKRWTRNYYLRSQSIFKKQESKNATDVHIEVQTNKKSNLFTAQEKFRKASILGSKLAELLSLSSHFNFERRMKQIEKIINIWQERKEFLIEELNIESNEIETNEFEIEELNIETDEIEELNIVTDEIEETNEYEIEELNIDTLNENHHSNKLPTVSDIKLPTKVKCCGRPKGAAKTTIGLPKKRGQYKPTPFKMQHYIQRENKIMEWLTVKEIVDDVRNKKYSIEEKDIECRPEMIFNGIIENDVNIHTIKPYCTKDAWQAILNVIKDKKKNIIWICPVCKLEIGEECVICDSCLIWYDAHCVGLNVNIKQKKYWFCVDCYKTVETIN